MAWTKNGFVLATPLDVVAQTFGEELSPDVIQAVAGMTRPEIERLYEAAKGWYEQATLSPKASDGELRPFLPEDHPTSRIPYRDPHDAPFFAADRVKRHLLYCHGLVMETYFLGHIENIINFNNERGGKYSLERDFVMLFVLKDLVEDGIVVYTPCYSEHAIEANWRVASDEFRKGLNQSLGSSGSRRLYRFIAPLVDDLVTDDYPPYSFGSSKPFFPFDPGLDENKVHLINQAINYISLSLELMIASSGAIDLDLPYLHQRQVLERLLGGEAARLVGGVNSLVMSNLSSVNLPRIEALDVKEIVALRKSEPVFELWRSGLVRALTSFRSDDLSSISDDDLRLVIRSELAESAGRLESDLNRHRLKGSAVTLVDILREGQCSPKGWKPWQRGSRPISRRMWSEWRAEAI